MTRSHDLCADPFREAVSTQKPKRMQLLGAACRFESDSRELLRLVDAAYAGVPAHRLSHASPELRIRLLLNSPPARQRRGEPPGVRMLSGNRLLGGTTSDSSWVILSPQEHAALVVLSPTMLRFPYHVRYEYIEFAIFTLAARVQKLIPLHAACVGRAGRGVLVMGASGSGKSTVALHSLLHGLEFVAEDAVFVAADTLQATGIANYLHIGNDSLHWLERSRDRAMIRRSPVIRRRSGVKKFEVDLRRPAYRLAASPLKLDAVVFLSPEPTRDRLLLRPLPKKELLSMLDSHQAYAANQPRWSGFRRNVSQLDAFELRRGRHPREAVDALQSILGSARTASADHACASP
jgi:hypothetical protein